MASEELKKKLCQRCNEQFSDEPCEPSECALLAVIENAEEVVHGRWIFKHNPIKDPKGYFIRIVCSECNLHTGQKSNYCPQCGAKMDLED